MDRSSASRHDATPLFSGRDVSHVRNLREQTLRDRVRAASRAELEAPHTLTELVCEARLEIPVLDRTRACIVAFSDRPRTAWLEVPFTGDPTAFSLRATGFDARPPSGIVDRSALRLEVRLGVADAAGARTLLDNAMSRIESSLAAIRADLEPWGETLERVAAHERDQRLATLDERRALLGAIGYEVAAELV